MSAFVYAAHRNSFTIFCEVDLANPDLIMLVGRVSAFDLPRADGDQSLPGTLNNSGVFEMQHNIVM
jgi:hypothetical protein